MKKLLIFIGGIPGTGKTTLSYQLALKLKTDKIINLDILKQITKIYINKEEDPYLYTTTHEAYAVDNLKIIEGFIKHSQSISEYVLNVINQFENEKIILIEGAQLTPKIIEEIDKDKFNVIYFNLYIKDKDFLNSRYTQKQKQRKGNWKDNIEDILLIQNYLLSYKNVNHYSSMNDELIGYILEDIHFL